MDLECCPATSLPPHSSSIHRVPFSPSGGSAPLLVLESGQPTLETQWALQPFFTEQIDAKHVSWSCCLSSCLIPLLVFSPCTHHQSPIFLSNFKSLLKCIAQVTTVSPWILLFIVTESQFYAVSLPFRQNICVFSCHRTQCLECLDGTCGLFVFKRSIRP